MTNEDQKKIVAQAYTLETMKQETTQKIRALKMEQYTKPAEPKRGTVKREYPEIKPKFNDVKKSVVPFLVVIVVIWFVRMIVNASRFSSSFRLISATTRIFTVVIVIGIPIAIFMCIKIYKQEKENYINNTKASPEYQAKCAELNAQYDKRQRELDEKYAADMEQWKTVLMPEYNKGPDYWRSCQDEKIKKASDDVVSLNNALGVVYKTNVIPSAYHGDITALKYFFDVMNKTNCNIVSAINAYQNYLRELEEEAIRREEERERRREERRDFERTVAASALGSYVGTKQANKSINRNSSRRNKKYHYTCHNCPIVKNSKNYASGYGPNRCKRNPETCGYGFRY